MITKPQFDIDSGGGNGTAEKKKRNTQSYKTLYEDRIAEVNNLKNKLFVWIVLTISEFITIITLLLSR